MTSTIAAAALLASALLPSAPVSAAEKEQPPAEAHYRISDKDFIAGFRVFYDVRRRNEFKRADLPYRIVTIDRSNPRMILVLVLFGDTPYTERYEVCRVDTRTLRNPADVSKLAFCNYLNTRTYRDIEKYLALRAGQRPQEADGEAAATVAP